MAEKTAQEKMMDRFKVKVFKTAPDDRLSLCGEKLQIDPATGKHYFVIPGHQADYINRCFPSYQVSEPYIPGVDLESALKLQEKPLPDLAPERMATIKRAIEQIPVDKYGQPAGGRPAMPKVGDVSAIVGSKVSAEEILAAMAGN